MLQVERLSRSIVAKSASTLRQRSMAQPRSAFQQAQEAAVTSNVHTTNALKRWSVGDKELPSMINLE